MSTMSRVVGAWLMISQVGVAMASEPTWSDTQELKVGGTVQGRLETEIKDGWLHVRRFDAGKELVWAVVLCRAEAAVPPVVRADGALEVRNASDRYFIREITSMSRVNGVLETIETEQAEVDTSVIERATWQAVGSGGGLSYGACEQGAWNWMVIGHLGGPRQALIRMIPTLLIPEKDDGVGGSSAGLVHFERDEAALSYDGESLQVRYVTMEEATRELNRRGLAAGTKPPEVDAQRWINPFSVEFQGKKHEIKTLAHLYGNVVLVDFWATWCTPCIEKLPYVQKLHEKYAGKGLVVVAVHSVKAEEMDTFLQKHEYSFPIALDTGETARRFGIEGIPQYVLIGRDGKLVNSGLQYSPPSETEIEQLLATSRPAASSH